MADKPQPITINGEPMRLAWGSNSPLTPGGYGQQTRLICRSLRDRLGIIPAVSSTYGQMNGKLVVDGIDVYPQAYRPFGNDIHAANAKQHGAHILLTHQDVPWQDPHAMSAGGTRWVSWYPTDHTPLSPKIVARLRPEFCYQPIALSHFGEQQARDAGIDIRLVVQGIDTNVFIPGDRAAARAALGWPADAFIVGIVAQNRGYPDRKAYPEQLRGFRAFAQKHSDALIYIHAFGNDELDPEAHTDLPGHLGDMLPRALWAHPFDLNMGYTQADMVLRYQAFDVLLGVSMAEGFGLPLIEAQSVGVPVITGNWTAMAENCYAGWLVERSESRPWYTTPYGPLCEWRLPYEEAITDRLETAYTALQNDGARRAYADFGRESIVTNHDQDMLIDTQWRAVLSEIAERIEAEPTPYHRHVWAETATKTDAGLIAPCQVVDCPAELCINGTKDVHPRGAPVVIDGISLDIEDDPNGGQRHAIASEIVNAYRLQELAFQDGDVVIDVGAHVGIVSCYLAKKWPGIKVYAIEPVTANYLRLVRNLQANGCANIKPLCAAVASDEREITLTGDPERNTGHYSAFAERGTVDETAYSQTIPGILKRRGIERVALLKLDCEGAEYEILYGMGAGLSQVDRLVMEVHENNRLVFEHGGGARLVEYAKRMIPSVRASIIPIPDSEEVQDGVVLK